MNNEIIKVASWLTPHHIVFDIIEMSLEYVGANGLDHNGTTFPRKYKVSFISVSLTLSIALTMGKTSLTVS